MNFSLAVVYKIDSCDLKKIFLHLFIFERQRQRVSRVGEEREADTESKAGSRLQAVSPEPDGALTCEPWDHDPSQSQTLNQLSHPGTPDFCDFDRHCIESVDKVGKKWHLTILLLSIHQWNIFPFIKTDIFHQHLIVFHV